MIGLQYVHQKKGIHYGNIRWSGSYPMRSGKFPKNHPCAPSSGWVESCQAGDSEALRNFRALGYWASCFPEGDGITLQSPDEKTPEMVMRDIKDCFGWDAKEMQL